MCERLVSLAPSATRVVEALEAGDRLVAVTAHDAPASDVGGWLTPDLDAVAAAEPDLVLTTDALQAEFAEQLHERGLEVAHFDPRTLADVEGYIRQLGRAIGRGQAADDLAARFRTRLERIRTQQDEGSRPVVYCEEWDEPPMAAGNWIPELVGVAGGRYPFCEPGERSHPVDVDEIAAAEPEYALVHHCGRDDVSAACVRDRGWEIPHVHALPDDLLNQPGPQLAEAAARMATILETEPSP